MTDLIYTPKRHICDGLSGQTNGPWWYPSMAESVYCIDGAVRRCQCGKTWVAGHLGGVMPAVWRPEGRFERWWRERRGARE